MKKPCLCCVMITLTALAQPNADQTSLLEKERQWNQALKSHDAAWVEKNFAIDASDVSSGSGALHTKTDDVAMMKEDKTVYEALELSDLKVRVEGNAGIVTGINHLKGRDETGQEFDLRLAFTDTYIKRHGGWQVWATQHTRVKP